MDGVWEAFKNEISVKNWDCPPGFEIWILEGIFTHISLGIFPWYFLSFLFWCLPLHFFVDIFTQCLKTYEVDVW